MSESEHQRPLLTGTKLKSRALDLLSRRDHSVRELARKLRQKGGDDVEIAPLLQDLQEWGYLDDRRFAEGFVRFRLGKSWGRRRYQQELIHRGVDASLADQVLSEMEEFESEAVLEKLSDIVSRELFKGRPQDRVVASLLRKGFSMALVMRAIEKVESASLGE